MLRYNIASMVNRRSGTQLLLPEQHPSLAAERSYLRVLRVMLRALRRAIETELVPVVRSELTRDADASLYERMRALAVALARTATETVTRILRLETERHTKDFIAKAKRSMGVDLVAVVRNADLEDYMDVAATRNAGLITNISTDTVDRIQTLTTNAVLQGRTAKQLQIDLVNQFGIADSRAKLIARDQISKVTSELNEIRHKQAGIDEYEWITSRDERVRPRHRALDGRVYKYGEATGAEGGLSPGRPIRCRCIARAIVKF